MQIIVITRILSKFDSILQRCYWYILLSYLPEMMYAMGMESTKIWHAWFVDHCWLLFKKILIVFCVGFLIDRHGRKNGLILCLSLASVMTLFFGSASNYYQLLIARTLLGAVKGLSIICNSLSTEVCN